MTIDQRREFIDMGVYLGLTYICVIPNYIIPDVDKFEAASLIRELGADCWAPQTDLTQMQNTDPIEGIRIRPKVDS